jgi:hypothetical protein
MAAEVNLDAAAGGPARIDAPQSCATGAFDRRHDDPLDRVENPSKASSKRLECST